jgi:Rrf2 family transcriptional regulator, iron-sulfur cluster assembly transcription factor
MVLSKGCEYTIRAIIYMALNKDKTFFPIRELSQTLDISHHFLTKNLQVLTQAGLIESGKGPGGGVALRKATDEISVFDIVNAIDGNKIFDNCLLGHPSCNDLNPCSLHKLWKVSVRNLQEGFMQTSLAELADDINKGKIQFFIE